MSEPTPVGDIFTGTTTRALAERVLVALADEAVIDPSGRAVSALQERLGIATSGHVVWRVLNGLSDGGWIDVDKNARRTHRIELASGDLPIPEPEPEVTEPRTDDELDGRPGRLAARLERQMPAIVEAAVERSLSAALDGLFAGFGYSRAEIDSDQLLMLKQELAARTRGMEQLREEVRAMRLEAEWAHNELNRALRGTNAGQAATKGLRPSEVAKVYYELAEHAIANGWTVTRSRGGHLVFTSPTGEPYFAASTPSDPRSVANTRAGLERLGLPKERS